MGTWVLFLTWLTCQIFLLGEMSISYVVKFSWVAFYLYMLFISYLSSSATLGSRILTTHKYQCLMMSYRRNIKISPGFWRMRLVSISSKASLKGRSLQPIICLWCMGKSLLLSLPVPGNFPLDCLISNNLKLLHF